MTSDKLPAVLTFKGKQTSISMERALKQALELLTWHTQGLDDPAIADKIQASIDDIELMIRAIER